MFPKIYLLGTIIDTYNLCMVTSLITTLIAVLMLRPKEIAFKYIFWATIIVLFFSLLGANLLFIIIHASEYNWQSIEDAFKTSGVAYLGAPILGLFALWVFSRCVKIPFLVLADYAAPFFMLDRVIGRIGCLEYGCCYGIPSNLPWAYPFNSWGIVQIVPRHPTQAYELIYTLAIFASARYFYKKIKSISGAFAINYKEARSSGMTFFYVFFCYSLLRFFNEFLRAEGSFIYGAVKISHIVLAIFAIISAICLFTIIKKSTAKNEILKILKIAVIRLALWFVVSSVLILFALTLYRK